MSSRRDRITEGHLTIVLPAFNEEDALAGTLREVLDARPAIVRDTQAMAVNVVCVNDGSTDRTQAIVEGFDEVQAIRFEHNRGYGAALKAGFGADSSEWVAFMDADGTLRPESFVDLLNKLVDEDADVVLGARLGEETGMPWVRRFGNRLFAGLLGFISGQPLSDCASGMRVIRRRALKSLMPLPDGLHFTPAMSCMALLDRRLSIAEVPVPYAERIGRSKLSVVRDGVRFLLIILLLGAFYNPLKCAVVVAVAALGGAAGLVGLGWDPQWVGWTLVAVQSLLAGAALLCHRAVKVIIVGVTPDTFAERVLHACIGPRRVGAFALLLLGVAAGLGLGSVMFPVAFGEAGRRATLALAALGSGLLLLAVSLRMVDLIGLKLLAMAEDPFTKTESPAVSDQRDTG